MNWLTQGKIACSLIFLLAMIAAYLLPPLLDIPKKLGECDNGLYKQ